MVPMDFAPLFGPVPGGMEIIVVLLIALLLFGLPVILIGGGLYLYHRSKSDRPADEEIAALRDEVQHLREDVRRLNDDRPIERRGVATRCRGSTTPR